MSENETFEEKMKRRLNEKIASGWDAELTVEAELADAEGGWPTELSGFTKLTLMTSDNVAKFVEWTGYHEDELIGGWDVFEEGDGAEELPDGLQKIVVSPINIVVHGRLFAERLNGWIESDGMYAWVRSSDYWRIAC